ncbi:MAG: protein-export chaperone SecB [Saprospiraceae bacterium]
MKEKSDIQLRSITIEKSTFVRGELPMERRDFNMNLSTFNEVKGNRIYVFVNVVLEIAEFPDFRMDITMLGNFEKQGEIKVSLEDFCNINAPAIIFPYVRQYIRNLSMDAGLNPIMLPVINFVGRYNIMKEKKNL